MKKQTFLALSALALAFATPASAAITIHSAIMDGPSEAPPNTSSGTGQSTVTIDDVLNTMRVQVSFSGLTGNTTTAHIHGPTALPNAGTAGVMTQTPVFPSFPLGVTSGAYDQTFDMTMTSSYNPAFVTANGGTAAAAFSALQTAMNDGKAYFNLHSSAFPGGEIRGFYAVVPEPSSVGLAGLAALGLMRRRR